MQLLPLGAELLPVSLEPSAVSEAYEKDIDRTLLRESSKRSTQARVEPHPQAS